MPSTRANLYRLQYKLRTWEANAVSSQKSAHHWATGEREEISLEDAISVFDVNPSMFLSPLFLKPLALSLEQAQTKYHILDMQAEYYGRMVELTRRIIKEWFGKDQPTYCFVIRKTLRDGQTHYFSSMILWDGPWIQASNKKHAFYSPFPKTDATWKSDILVKTASDLARQHLFY